MLKKGFENIANYLILAYPKKILIYNEMAGNTCDHDSGGIEGL